jgi:UPF0755 protein
MRVKFPRFFFFLAAFGVLAACAKPPDTPSEYRLFHIERGASAQKIARALTADGFIHHPWSLLIWIKLDPNNRKAIHPGVYSISPADTGYRILQLLRQGPPSARITFPEGWTAQQMAALLEAHNIVPAAAFLSEVEKEKLEGYLFPDTYDFDQGSSADAVIGLMRHRLTQKLPPDWAARQKALHLSERELITLASIVEREARVPQERPVIAGVFMNRLHKHWRLESCATVEYALGKWKPRLTYKDLDVASPYNTYRHGGLPPGPIGNPGAAALNAAAHPAQTDMMFFVAAGVGDGTHQFTRYYKEHLAVQKKK